MDNSRLQLKNVGQIRDANIEFGDLTVLIGPQATGKSIFLQFLRLLVDTGYVFNELRKYGFVWGKDIGQFLDIYLGEGMKNVWSAKKNRSVIVNNGVTINLAKVIQEFIPGHPESLFFIPAQRVLTLGRGWPRPFSDYGSGDPFSVRDFSENIRLLMEAGWGSREGGEIFPQIHRLKSEFRNILNDTVFYNFGLRVDTYGAQKRLILKSKESETTLPFMVWSAGQREFVPLLMGYYWLLPPSKVTRRRDVEWVVIEEPETGLHPNAISSVLLLILDLLARGYRVCLSTHSSHVLDVIWALKVIQEHKAPSSRILDLFNTEKTASMKEIADKIIKKTAKVYYFDRETGMTQDISGLDPGSKEASESGWGGLSEFSGRVAEVVASVVNS